MQAQASTPFPPLGLYIHVPFCAHRCHYCAFYQKAPRRKDVEDYLQGLSHSFQNLTLTRSFDTLYWGGGTPGILTPRDMLFIGKQIQDLPYAFSPSEWTVELAPHTVKAEKLSALREMRVNRISMGVQSFSEKTLQQLGRRQNPQHIAIAYDMLREYGFHNIGLDLIFAVPHQTLSEWEEDLRIALSFHPEHISTYNLSLEGNSKMNLSKKFRSTEASLERERAFYLLTVDTLESAGYEHYEISNFCLPGRESRHNLHTWQMAEWIGIGPSASSQYGRERYTQYPSLERWIQALQDGKPSANFEKKLNDRTLFEDSCIFGLRTSKGIDLEKLHQRYPLVKDICISHLKIFFQQLIDLEYMSRTSPFRYGLTLEGMLRCDAIGAEILQPHIDEP